MDLEDIILSEIIEMEKDKYHMISLMCGTQNKKVTNKQQNKRRTHRYRQQNGSQQKGRSGGSVAWVKGVRMVMEGNQTFGDENVVKYTDIEF